MRNTLFILGLISIIFGGISSYRTIQFIKRSVKVEATVLGFSSVQQLDRVEGDCSAFRKACAAKVQFQLPATQEQIQTLVPQPLFARVPTDKLMLFVDPSVPTEPRIASIHVLFRNASSTIFLGITCLFLSWLLKPRKRS